ncbi:MAG: MerR family transcriptional regulator [Candidatus Electryoneaceae bacterium]|nr:MerR family transcriptional regulator [Candidatus Electryoneaceae bacterium]
MRANGDSKRYRNLSDLGIPKLYYLIGEVGRIIGVEAHVLRYWETEFKELAPNKNNAGKRTYRKSDIAMALRIRELLYNDRYTIEGARLRLKSYTFDDDSEVNSVADMYLQTYHRLEEIRHELLELKKMLVKEEE